MSIDLTPELMGISEAVAKSCGRNNTEIDEARSAANLRLVILAQSDKVDHEKNPSSYLYASALRAAQSAIGISQRDGNFYLRKFWRDSVSLEELYDVDRRDPVDPLADDPYQVAERNEAELMLTAALTGLPLLDRSIVQYRACAGMKWKDVCKRVRVCRRVALDHYKKSLEILRETLEEKKEPRRIGGVNGG